MANVEAADTQVGEKLISDTESAQVLSSGRDVEINRKVLDRNKGAVIGKSVEMLIVYAPNGRVSDCSFVSSELNDSPLENKLITRLKLINFGAVKLEETSINYSFIFLPF
ncbi:MAG: hypothetical protein ACPGSN_06560 [Psychrobium sp.]